MLTLPKRRWFYGVCFAMMWISLLIMVSLTKHEWLGTAGVTLSPAFTFGALPWLEIRTFQGPAGVVWSWNVHSWPLLGMLLFAAGSAVACFIGWRLAVKFDWLRDVCDGCGYSRHSVSDRCPECGTPVQEESEKERLSSLYPGLGRGVLWRFLVTHALILSALGFRGAWSFAGDLNLLEGSVVGGVSSSRTWATWIPLVLTWLCVLWMCIATKRRLNQLRSAGLVSSHARSTLMR